MDDPAKVVTVLDYIDNITVPGNVFAEPANEYWALVCLHQGMEYLYHQVRKCDESVRQRVNPLGNMNVMCGGNLPEFAHLPKGLLTCAFHWYAISACQYVRTVGAIAVRHDAARPLPQDYAKTVIPEVIAFRDKVAAHFAWCTANKRDNAAERLASILPSLTFAGDCLQIAGYRVHLRQGEEASNSTAIQSWSLCRVHERLRQRYWPESESESEKEGAGEKPANQ